MNKMPILRQCQLQGRRDLVALHKGRLVLHQGQQQTLLKQLMLKNQGKSERPSSHFTHYSACKRKISTIFGPNSVNIFNDLFS